MPCFCHVKQQLTCGVVIQLQPYNCVSEFRFRLNWISCIAPSLPCHAYHIDHVGSSLSVVVRIASVVCVPAFASSRIGSRSVDVRYDEFSDKFFCNFSQASPPPWPILQLHSRCSPAIFMLRFFESRVLFHCYPYEPCYLSSSYRRCLLFASFAIRRRV